MSEYPRAVVREIDGQLVLDDPDAAAMFTAIAKHNCRGTAEQNRERIVHFKKRMEDLNRSSDQTVIVILNVNDIRGEALAEALMPGYNWQEIRDRGEVPFARGLAERSGIQWAIEAFDTEAAEKLRNMKDIAVVVVDHGVAEVFEAQDELRGSTL